MTIGDLVPLTPEAVAALRTGYGRPLCPQHRRPVDMWHGEQHCHPDAEDQADPKTAGCG